MRKPNRVVSLKLAVALVGMCALVLCCTGAVAQNPPAPEKNLKAWEIEAKSVAQSIGLAPDLTAKLVDAYKAARESHMAALQAKMGEGQGGRRNFAGMREVNQAEKAKLETALKGFLNPEQTAKALAALGTFGRQWDRMVMTLDGMNLAEKAKADALKLVTDYVAESGKAMEAAAAAGGDFQSVRDQMGKIKEKLDEDMAKILSPDQIAKWKEETARRGPRGPGGPAPAPAAPKPAAK